MADRATEQDGSVHSMEIRSTYSRPGAYRQKQASHGGGLHGRQRPGCIRRESGNPRTGFKGIGRYSKQHDVRGWSSSRKWRFPLNGSVRKSPQSAAFKFRGPLLIGGATMISVIPSVFHRRTSPRILDVHKTFLTNRIHGAPFEIL